MDRGIEHPFNYGVDDTMKGIGEKLPYCDEQAYVDHPPKPAGRQDGLALKRWRIDARLDFIKVNLFRHRAASLNYRAAQAARNKNPTPSSADARTAGTIRSRAIQMKNFNCASVIPVSSSKRNSHGSRFDFGCQRWHSRQGQSAQHFWGMPLS
jgi:hypothetical protein